MGGRVKTLHPKIYAGLLRRPGVDDEAVLETHRHSTYRFSRSESLSLSRNHSSAKLYF